MLENSGANNYNKWECTVNLDRRCAFGKKEKKTADRRGPF